MEFVKNWALCLIAAAAAGTLATVIVPRGSMDKTVRAVVGIFVVAVICAPFAEIRESDLSVEAFADSYETDFSNSYTEEMQERITDIFKETVDAQIKETASELNTDVISVNADISVDKDLCINIHKIDVVVNKNQFSDTAYLSEKISERLGVPTDVTAE